MNVWTVIFVWMFGLCHFGLTSVPCTSVYVCNIFCLDFATLDCNTIVWTVIFGQCVLLMAGHKCSCYLHVLYNILGFRLIRRVSGIRGFRFWGWIFTRIDFRDGFGFQVRVSVLGAQTLHPIRTRSVAIFTHWW